MEDISKILDHIAKLYAEKETLAVKIAAQREPELRFRSEDIKDLATALSKAQNEFEVAGKNKENPFFKSKYADLKSVVSAARPALCKYGLSVVQDLINDEDNATWLYTILLHNSGQYIESRLRMTPPKNDIQSISSYNTYMKRMTYASLVGVVTGDEDDDGEIAMEDVRSKNYKGTQTNNNYNARQQTPEVITKEQLESLEYELAEFPEQEQADMVQKMYEAYDIRSLADLPKGKFQVSIERLRKIKLTRKGLV